MATKRHPSKALTQRILIRIAFIIVFIFAFIYLIWPVCKLLSPALLAALLAAFLSPLLNKIYGKIKIPKKLLALVLVLLVLTLLIVPLYFLVREGFYQAQSFAQDLRTQDPLDFDELEDRNKLVAWIQNNLPEETQTSIKEALENFSEFLHEQGADILSGTFTISREIISQTTNIFLWILTFFMAFYFILAEYTEILNYLHSLLTSYSWLRLTLLKDSSVNAVGKYIHGVLRMGLFCTLYMLICFGLYGYPYAIVFSLICGLVDILPIVGSMTILIPWTIYELAIGDKNFGIFLFIISAVFFILRRILEPKVLGDSTGLHPLVTLVSMYAGLQLSNLFGAILAPVGIMVFLSILRTGLFDDWILDFHEFRTRLRFFLKRRKRGDSRNILKK